MKSHPFLVGALLTSLIGIAITPAYAQIVAGQVETFSLGTSGFIEGGNSLNPPIITNEVGSDGLPGHLINVSSGSGAGGRLHMFSMDPDWIGNYTAAGIESISFDADNRSGNGNALSLRIAIQGNGGFFLSNAVTLADGSGFTPLTFNLNSLTAITGSGILSDTLDSVNQFQILSTTSDTPNFQTPLGGFLQGDNIVADLRIDNLVANAAVPEPSSLNLLGLVLVSLACRRRRN